MDANKEHVRKMNRKELEEFALDQRKLYWATLSTVNSLREEGSQMKQVVCSATAEVKRMQRVVDKQRTAIREFAEMLAKLMVKTS